MRLKLDFDTTTLLRRQINNEKEKLTCCWWFRFSSGFHAVHTEAEELVPLFAYGTVFLGHG